jgi:hypothetical protein
MIAAPFGISDGLAKVIEQKLVVAKKTRKSIVFKRRWTTSSSTYLEAVFAASDCTF